MRDVDDPAVRGMLAVTWSGAPPATYDAVIRVLTSGPVTIDRGRTTALVVAGSSSTEPVDRPGRQEPVWLTRGARFGDRDVTDEDLWTWLSRDGRDAALDEVLPPFAAILMDPGRDAIRAATDYLGLRCLYLARGDGWAAISTSTAALGALTGGAVDQDSLAAYSLVGWRLGERTHYRDVVKLPPGTSVSLSSGLVQVWSGTLQSQTPAPLSVTVPDAAGLLRAIVEGVLDDHPDTLLQLTGGLDSRILLAAVPPARRPRLEAMTLRVDGSADAHLASALATRYGIRHRVVDVSAAQRLSPRQARDLVLDGARRVDFSSDPLAWAALSVAEDSLPQAPRLSGLGGEVVRGFYYVGRPTRSPSTTRRVTRLAHWRLFPNEGVPDGVLAPEFARWRRDITMRQIDDIFATLPGVWAEATDAFYLWQRMQRWAGATTTSTCLERFSVNPMLDHRFMQIGMRVAPHDRAAMRFLSRILLQLDPTLAGLPLDGRPAPRVYARPGPVNRARLSSLTLRKAVGKAGQRVRGTTRPAAGGPSLADRVVEYWRTDTSDLEMVRRTGIVRDDVLDRLVSGDVEPGPSTVGFLALLAAGHGATA